MNVFYKPDVENSNFLSKSESNHCINVLRHKQGDEILLIDGMGTLYKVRLISSSPKKTEFEIIEKTIKPKNEQYYLHLVISPTKNISRIEWFIEKSTEIGINEISLVTCSNSERKAVKTERLKKIAISAAKQSLNPYIPVIHDLVPFSRFLENRFEGEKFIAHCMEGDKKSITGLVKKNTKYLVLIGPEGDFSPREVELARKAGYTEITLGDSRLRTETAAFVACCAVYLKNI